MLVVGTPTRRVTLPCKVFLVDGRTPCRAVPQTALDQPSLIDKKFSYRYGRLWYTTSAADVRSATDP